MFQILFFESNVYLQNRNLVIGDLGHAKVYDTTLSNTKSSSKNFRTNSYLAPEGFIQTKRTVKLDFW